MPKRKKVITWQSPTGVSVDICKPCEDKLWDSGDWPRDARGNLLCNIKHGLHVGYCDYCTHVESED